MAETANALPERDVDYVLSKLDWMREKEIWPNGLRYLWTDAFGLVNYVSLYEQTGDETWLNAGEELVEEVDRVLGRERGYRIGEAPDRDGQYYHYLAMWLYALYELGRYRKGYRQKGIQVARDIHAAFVIPGRGVIWKMLEDLSAPYPGYGLGAMDAYDGYVPYRLLSADMLAKEIDEMRDLIEMTYRDLTISQDLGAGMMLWLSSIFPEEDWARVQSERCLEILDGMWMKDGYFCREPGYGQVRFAFTNYGISLGLQAQDQWPGRVERLNAYFESWRSGDAYDLEAITHVMACTSHLPNAFLAHRPQGRLEQI